MGSFTNARIGSLQMAAISFSGSGDNTVVAAIATNRIKVHRIFIVVGGSTNITFKHGTTAFTGALPMTANGGITLDITGEPWFITALNEAFVINSSSAVQVSGALWYDTYL